MFRVNCRLTLYSAYIVRVPALLCAYQNKIIQASIDNNFACNYQFTELARSHRKNARYENGKGNIQVLLETHLKKANRKTKDTLGGRC